MYNLWNWGPAGWFVVDSYETSGEAYKALRQLGAPLGEATIARVGSPKDNYLIDHATDRDAPLEWE